MIRLYALLLSLIIVSFVAGCDPQSGMTKKGLEKYNPTPTPERTPLVEEKIDPADVVTVDTTQSGPGIIINRIADKKPVDCNKYNKVTINGDGYEVEIKGICKQLMINGDKNKITGGAFTELIFNGEENTVEYYKYANGKKPFITENAGTNTVEKTVAPEKPDADLKK